ncbi:MAG: RNA-binding S4 domain-containing protein [Woeseiaceae bacterium]
MSDDSLRLDRWLWFTRFYKTRTAASAAVQGGHVRVNGERARTSVRIREGDEIRLHRQQLEYVLTVRRIPARRGPARDASACYEESEESIARRVRRLAELRRDRSQMPMTRGKPDKHTRRRLRQRNRDTD